VSISQQRLKELAGRSDQDIYYSDIPELDDRFFAIAELADQNKKENTLQDTPGLCGLLKNHL
jgi:hypothetical protein